jgi:hypothetical protein
MSLNPLLSLTTNNQSPNNDYNYDLYEDQSYDKNNRCYHEDYPSVDDDRSSQSSDDSLNQYYLIPRLHITVCVTVTIGSGSSQ